MGLKQWVQKKRESYKQHKEERYQKWKGKETRKQEKTTIIAKTEKARADVRVQKARGQPQRRSYARQGPVERQTPRKRRKTRHEDREQDRNDGLFSDHGLF